MKMTHRQQSGFSTVELLVALFVAVIFLAAGHQLYATIIQDSGETRQRAKANNIAYASLRHYVDNAPGTCAASTVVTDAPVTPAPENMTNVRQTVTYDCPQSSIQGLTRVVVRVTYGADQQEVIHAMYAIQ
jgi:Tfp pilus assembly protein PilV